MANPQLSVKVEIGFAATPSSDITTVTWTNVTSWLRLSDGITLQRGRQDETSQIGAGTASFALDNRDGRFTPENTSGAYYPNVQLRRPVRISYNTTPVWTGYIDSWGEGWNSGIQPVARIQASDLMARLAKSSMKSLITEEITADAPVLYFPLNDSAGTTSPGNQAATAYADLIQNQNGVGGTVAFGQSNTFGADTSETVAVFTRVDADNGKSFSQSWNPIAEMTAVSAVTLEAYVYIPVAVAATQPLAYLWRAGGTETMWILVNSALQAQAFANIGGVSAATPTAGPVLNDGAWHHLAATWNTTTLKLFLDGSLISSAALASASATFNTLIVGNVPTGTTAFNGWMAHVAYYNSVLSDTRILAHGVARNGGAGETSLARYNRVARLAIGSWALNSPATTPSATMTGQPFKDQSAAAIIQGVSDAEVAPVYISAAGVPVWQARSTRSTPPAAVSVPVTVVSSDTGFTTSDQLVVNDVTY